MQKEVLGGRHRPEPNLIERFVERGALRRRGEESELGEIQPRAPVVHVLHDEPVARHDFVEPAEVRLVRVAVVTRRLERLRNLRGHGCLGSHVGVPQRRPYELKGGKDADAREPAAPQPGAHAGPHGQNPRRAAIANAQMRGAIGFACVSGAK